MTDTNPPQLETKDLPHAGVPAAVPNTDRIGYEVAAEKDDADKEGDSATKTKATTRKTTESKS